MTYSVANIFHTTQLVRDLSEARTWFEKVFQRRAISWADRWDLAVIASDYPTDYSFMMQIGDLVHDALCPTMYKPPNSDSVLWDDLTGGLAGISWWLKDSRAFSQAMQDYGIGLRDQSGNRVEGGSFAPTLIVPNFSLMTTMAADTGFAHSFSEMLPPTLERYSAALPRLSSTYEHRPVSIDDPLRIERVAYHTLVTSNLERSLHFMTEVLNGKVFHRARDAATFPQERVYLHFADTVIEYLHRPDGDALDRYHQITFRTSDLTRAKAHLAECGVGLLEADERLVTTDPKHSLGARWGFISDYIQGDPRF